MDLTFCRFVAALFLILTAVHPALAQDGKDAKELRILRVTPEGLDVPDTRQIVIEFNRPVVPVGAMDRKADELGVTITPPLNCQWRWLNTSALSCNLSDQDAMKLSTAYTLDIAPKIKAEDGATIAEAYHHTFTTQRAQIDNANIQLWTAPGTPQFRLSFNQPVTKTSAAAHLYFDHDGTRTAAKISKPQDNDNEDDETESEKPVIVNGDEARYVWMAEPDSELPLDTHVTLKQESGLVSAEGTEASDTAADIREFYTFPGLSLKGVACTNAKGDAVRITTGQSQSDNDLCNPLQSISLVFSAPVLRSMVKDNLTITPDPAGGKKDVNAWGDVRDWSRLSDGRADKDAEYMIALPYGLKAAQSYTLALTAPKPTFWEWIKSLFTHDKTRKTRLADEFGRTLDPFTISFATGHRNPNYVLPYHDAVLEKNVDSDVPLYVNNLQSYTFDYRSLLANGANDKNTGQVSVPSVQDVQFAVPMNLRTMLGGHSGAVYGHVSTSPDVPLYDGADRLFAQVTPYQVYAKLGHFRSTVWVTDLSTGKPVDGAKVTFYKGQMTNLHMPDHPLAQSDTDKDGIAALPGTQDFDPDLALNHAYKDDDARLFVRVDKGDDMALLPVSYDYEVQLWNVAEGVYNDTNEKYGHMKAWGMTAQGIYRAGDTMQYKIYVRDSDNDRLVAPPAGKYTLEISDPTGKSVEKGPVTLSDFGTVSGDYLIPKNASVGWYSFKLEAVLKVAGKDVTKEFYPLSVLVSDFTPAPFRVTTELNGTHFKAGDTLNITSNAQLHSGGPYGDAAIRSTITLESRAFTSDSPKADGFYFSSFTDETGSEQLLQKEDKLNDKGEWTTSFPLPEKQIAYGQLRVESAVRDDRGKSIANEARADYVGVDRLVGVKPKEWVFQSKKPAVIETLVVDDKGQPVDDTRATVTLERQEVDTAKVKSAGNAYLNDNTVTWSKVADCTNKASLDAQDCTFTPDTAGTYRATASIKDTKGRAHSTTQEFYVSGSDYVQWNEGRENALTIIPEKTSYKVGDTARYLVKNPYPGATAYISVERFGVIDSFVKVLDGSSPIIEIPVKDNYVPGFYVSVVVTSPRVESPPVEMNQIDLGKPAFRVGYVKTTVEDPYKEMVVTAKTDAEVYRPRDTVKVDLTASPRHDTNGKPPIELAVAVLDESVFDLIMGGRDAFDVYKGFYDLPGLDVSNYSLLSRLIGRQKFEKKGANAGGDGGADAGMRNLFKFVSYWNPSVPVGPDGKAHIEFQAPDNLTGWRVLAIADTPDDLMGLGEANFKVNRPTEVRPVMPNQVREGDNFSAGFSVMNRTDAPREIKVTIEAGGDLDGKDVQTKEETVKLDSYKRATVYFPLKAALLPVTRDLPEGKISFKVTAGDATDSDAMEYSILLLKSRTFDTAANYATTTDDTASETIAVPKDIYTDSGDLSVVLSPTVLANLDGAFKYMRDYIYPCWEQKISVAVMAAHYKNLKPYLSVTWDDADSKPRDILNMAADYQAPNGGMAYYEAKDEYVDPYLSAYTALAFQWLKKSGYTVPQAVEDKLDAYLLGFLRNDAAPDYYQDGMVSTVRAVILSALKDSGKIGKEDVIRFKSHVKGMSLFGKAQYMQAAQAFPETKDAARDTLGMILSSGVESGGKFSFNDAYDDGYSRILATPLRDNCAVLDVMMEYPDKDLIGDKPFKLVRMITQSRGNRDHWENTQENLFCMNALVDYARVYESDKPDMKVAANFKDKDFGNAAFHDVKDAPVTLSRPLDDKDPGTTSPLSLVREGSGRLYYATRLRYALKSPADGVNAGMDVHREYSIRKDGKWILASSPVSMKRGDLVKIDLYVSLPTARNFVVVNDPLPGGLETVNRDLATTSSVDADQALYDQSGGSWWFKFNDWQEFNVSRWSFYHQELRNDSARFYADWLEPGNYHLTYMAQAIASGTFAAPPTQAEEMYDPDVYGRGAKGELVVQDAP